MRDRFHDAPVSCASTISTNWIFQFGGTILGVRTRSSSPRDKRGRRGGAALRSGAGGAGRTARGLASQVHRQARVGGDASSQPVAIASAITPNASAFRVRAASTVMTSVTALPATSAAPLKAMRAVTPFVTNCESSFT